MTEQPIDGSLGVVVLKWGAKVSQNIRNTEPISFQLTVRRSAFFDCAAVKPIMLICSICSADGSGPAFVVALDPGVGIGSSMSNGRVDTMDLVSSSTR